MTSVPDPPRRSALGAHRQAQAADYLADEITAFLAAYDAVALAEYAIDEWKAGRICVGELLCYLPAAGNRAVQAIGKRWDWLDERRIA